MAFTASESRGRLWVRGVLFVLIASFLIGGPVARQVFGLNLSYLRTWQMFSGKSLGVFDVQYFRVDRGSKEWTRIDREKELGYKNLAETPRKKRLIKSKAEIEIEAQLLCKKTGAQEVYVLARKAVRSGWKPVLKGQKNYCLSHSSSEPEVRQPRLRKLAR